MPRLFIALSMPEEQRACLAALQDPALAARWLPAHQLHLTLRFIGEVSHGQAEAFEGALAGLRAAPFVLSGEGLGLFPSFRRPRVLYLGLRHEPALHTLAQRVAERLASLGLPADPKPFRPHITLARLPRLPLADLRAYLRAHLSFTLDPFDVRHVTLYESRLRPEGALYVPRARFELTAPASDAGPA